MAIIQHQGTPRETTRRETIVFDRKHTVAFSLNDGRRAVAEYVPPAAASKRAKKPTEQASTDRVLNQLRAKADTEFRGGESSGMRGRLASLGVPVPSPQTRPLERSLADQVVYQTKVASAIPSSAELTAQLTMAPDQGSVLRLSPVFQTVQKAQAMPALSNPLIPGGVDASGGR